MQNTTDQVPDWGMVPFEPFPTVFSRGFRLICCELWVVLLSIRSQATTITSSYAAMYKIPGMRSTRESCLRIPFLGKESCE